jgi:hypothetical protein
MDLLGVERFANCKGTVIFVSALFTNHVEIPMSVVVVLANEGGIREVPGRDRFQSPFPGLQA